ncbi:Fur family transcriptional regulator [Sinomicrobium weinanense]|uniref:Transcriptional repressor n=1 Tax=Sinomicrobium weinanense TaxID=2842200 RepID=A0A926JNE1_9FLAO|nr:transcriptional repressor [Sinomicrobium weinanense]MBC9794419.1 transcriptional repressor [Sinomicrobium weinanense]MBU3124326.1 transcriptional repressor [Sinomicrobium weinanense]
MLNTLISFIEDKGVRATPVRILTLEQFYKDANAKSLVELQILLDTVDKATIYRTLKTFEKHGILHAIDTDGDAVKYALCSPLCRAEEHRHTHPHFVCEKCGITHCLDKTRVSLDNLPSDHSIDNIAVIVKGLCPSCKTGGR